MRAGTLFHFDNLVEDMQIPVMDGLTATREIRKLPEWSALPIVAMTANAMDSDRVRCIEAGMNDYVPKPIDPDQPLMALRPQADSSIDVAKLREVCIRLITELAADDFASGQTFDENQALMRAALGEKYATISADIHDFNFSQAMEHLRDAVAGYGVKL
jgi:CheY-like chemotaxis protein